MRYAQIRQLDISNGEGVGVALFVQGCHFHCNNCFNSETWDFNGGKEWTRKEELEFLKLSKRPFIKRVSILGGEPLCEENAEMVLKLISQIPDDKKIWIYTGYKYEDLMLSVQKDILNSIDYLVDGQFIDNLKDLGLKFRGSSNQRVIDVQETIKRNKIIIKE